MAVNGNIKRQHTPEFKTQVVLSMLKEEDTLSQIAQKYSIHPTVARRWRDTALTGLKNIFTGKTSDVQIQEKDKLIDELYKKVGQKEIELEWMKKKVGLFNH